MHSVYMENANGQDIYVMASLNPEWAIVDFITSVRRRRRRAPRQQSFPTSLSATHIISSQFPRSSSAGLFPLAVALLKHIRSCMRFEKASIPIAYGGRHLGHLSQREHGVGGGAK
jgi:hypothetical protein